MLLKFSPTAQRIITHFTATGNRPRSFNLLMLEMGVYGGRVATFNTAAGELIQAGVLERVSNGPVTLLRIGVGTDAP